LLRRSKDTGPPAPADWWLGIVNQQDRPAVFGRLALDRHVDATAWAVASLAQELGGSLDAGAARRAAEANRRTHGLFSDGRGTGCRPAAMPRAAGRMAGFPMGLPTAGRRLGWRVLSCPGSHPLRRPVTHSLAGPPSLRGRHTHLTSLLKQAFFCLFDDPSRLYQQPRDEASNGSSGAGWPAP
jgi:hypothetical protein